MKEIIFILGYLVAIGVIVNNDDIIQIVLNVLPNNYDVFIQFVFARHEYPTFDEFVGQLIHEDNRNFYVMPTNMKKKFFSLKTSALLKVMMRMTFPMTQWGPFNYYS